MKPQQKLRQVNALLMKQLEEMKKKKKDDKDEYGGGSKLGEFLMDYLENKNKFPEFWYLFPWEDVCIFSFAQ